MAYCPECQEQNNYVTDSDGIAHFVCECGYEHSCDTTPKKKDAPKGDE